MAEKANAQSKPSKAEKEAIEKAEKEKKLIESLAVRDINDNIRKFVNGKKYC